MRPHPPIIHFRPGPLSPVEQAVKRGRGDDRTRQDGGETRARGGQQHSEPPGHERLHNEQTSLHPVCPSPARRASVSSRFQSPSSSRLCQMSLCRVVFLFLACPLVLPVCPVFPVFLFLLPRATPSRCLLISCSSCFPAFPSLQYGLKLLFHFLSSPPPPVPTVLRRTSTIRQYLNAPLSSTPVHWLSSFVLFPFCLQSLCLWWLLLS